MRAVVFGYLSQKFHIANNQIGLGNKAKPQSAMQRKLLEQSASHAVATLRRLVRIGGRANRNTFARSNFLQLLRQKSSRLLFHINLLLKSKRIALLHKLMRVARVTVFTRKLAPSIRIEVPLKRQPPPRRHSVQHRPCRQRKVLDIVPFAQRIGVRSKPGNPDKRGWAGVGEEGKRRHVCSVFIRLQ